MTPLLGTSGTSGGTTPGSTAVAAAPLWGFPTARWEGASGSTASTDGSTAALHKAKLSILLCELTHVHACVVYPCVVRYLPMGLHKNGYFI